MARRSVHSVFVIATFDDARGLLQAVRAARAASYRIFDAYGPHPVHGLDEAMGIRPSRLPWVTFVCGACALLFAVLLQFYTAVWDWPLDVGGKPDNSALAFVPVAFEITVLVAALSTVGAFLLRARLHPGRPERLLAEGVTEDVFALALRKKDNFFDVSRVRELLLASGARDVEVKEADA
jgi:Protein of unknown function (DUF3341)